MSRTERELMTSAAHLYYLDNLSQQEIAAILDVSRPKVSRLLTAARELGIVRISVDPWEARDADLERELTERFGLRRAVVVRAPSRSVDSVRRAISHFAGPAVAEAIAPGATVGVSGGRTLGEVVANMRLGGGAGGVNVVQLMGHVDPTARKVDGPEIGRTLAREAGGSFTSLNAPIFVRDRETRDGFLADPQIQRVWRQFPLLDVSLVGVGALEESVFAERGVLTAPDFAALRDAGVVGEICGRFYDRDGQECETVYRDRVVSIGLDDLRRSDVIAVTNGVSRREAIHAALRGRLISSLVIDDVGARALLKGAGNAPSLAGRSSEA